MFSIILPKNRQKNLSRLETMFEKRGGRDVFDTDKTIYIVYENPAQSLFGSARLNPVSESILTDVGFFDKATCDTLGFLELSLVSFDDRNFSSSDPNKDIFKSWFYMGLTEVLRTLSLTQNLKGVVSVNTPQVHNTCVDYGNFYFEEAFELPHSDGKTSSYCGFILYSGFETSLQNRRACS
ncbi:MAG: hypothetical protein ACK5TR_01520 [Alphaproteobacteria bacterium]|jgi:hypothetical protein